VKGGDIMAQNKTDDYKNMLMDKVKENYLSIALGFLVFLVAITLIFRSAGNVKTTNTEKTNTAETTSEQKKYTVKQGDSVSSIARDQLGSMDYKDAIVSLNGLKNPNAIEVGQVLMLPEVGEETSPSVTPSPSPVQKEVQKKIEPTVQLTKGGNLNGAGTGTKRVTVSGTSYKVQKGDTLMSIAEKAYGDKSMYTAIMKANGLRNPNRIEAGMTLKLPR